MGVRHFCNRGGWPWRSPGEISHGPRIISLVSYGSTHPFSRSWAFNRQLSNVTTSEAKSDDGRTRLSRLWIPTGGITATSDEGLNAHLDASCVKSGLLLTSQAHSGIFHILPLGRRVQDKLEALIDNYMFQLSASKLALSSISSEELWSKSGRLAKGSSELFHFPDRKENKYLLSPTHEEEITSLVSSTVRSYKDVPVRLYQISRKYRDELRPRHGLLRSREFIMKDLYTFDHSPALALATYQQVREAYAAFFNEFKLPYLIADADSGDIGGDLSHEFHFATSKGEDNVISCSSCDYVANEELAESPISRATPSSEESDAQPPADNTNVRVWRGISRDRSTLVNVWYSASASLADHSPPVSDINIYAVKRIYPDLDASINDPIQEWNHAAATSSGSKPHDSTVVQPRRIMNILDGRLPLSIRESIETGNSQFPILPASDLESNHTFSKVFVHHDPSTNLPLNLLRIADGDLCPHCEHGSLRVQKTIELGHTFHLGTRYSEPLGATIVAPPQDSGAPDGAADMKHKTQQSARMVPMQMGCHGIGVSRIVGAVADILADEKGLNWPRVIAPFEVVVVPSKGKSEAAEEVYDVLAQFQSSGINQPSLDVILDDRTESFAWKMQDADLVGYPVVVVVGRKWFAEQMCEVQCRRLKIRENVPITDLGRFVDSLLSQL